MPQDKRTATLAQQFIAAKAVPATEPEDAAHMVSPQAKRQLEQTITQLGCTPPLLATPEEIFEAEST